MKNSPKFQNRIFIVGDSTVCDYSAALDRIYLPRYGYGTQLHRYLNLRSPSQIVNLALSGRSSLDFLTDGSGNYARLLSELAEGDYLVIGFGHNDEKREDAARFTDASKSYDDGSSENGVSFAYNLNENYIKPARRSGAVPILCTPIVRYDPSGEYVGSCVHKTPFGDYAEAIRLLGKAVGVTVIDLTEITRRIYKANNSEAVFFHSHSTYLGEKSECVPAGMDGTHLNEYGAKRVAYEFCKALSKSDCALKNYVLKGAAAPDFSTDFKSAVRADYFRPVYSPFDKNRASEKSLSPDGRWFSTVMGDVGGDGFSPFGAEFDDGGFVVWSDPKQAKGKISSSADGFAAAFMQIPSDMNFRARARAEILEAGGGANLQSAFGLMLRDDIYLYRADVAPIGNYIVSGALGYPEGKAIFSRESAELKAEDNGAVFSVGEKFDLVIVREGQKTEVVFKTADAVFSRRFFDFKLDLIDSDYMYLCLFATRSLKVKFTETEVEFTGKFNGA